MSAIRKVAVIGGGIAGTTCASSLKAAGMSVLLVDMGLRGPGGRMSSRTIDSDNLQFDHGCQFVAPARSPRVQELVRRLKAAGVMRDWEGRVGVLDAATHQFVSKDAFVRETPLPTDFGFCDVLRPGSIMCGYPSMAAVCEHLIASDSVDIRRGCRVSDLSWREDAKAWGLMAEHSKQRMPLGDFDAVVMADSMPMRQRSPGQIDMAAAGLAQVQEEFDKKVRTVPTVALMMAFPRSLGLPFDACTVTNSDSFAWIARDSSRPGRERDDGIETWVALTTPSYAAAVLQRCSSEAKGDRDSLLLRLNSHVLPEFLSALGPLLTEASGGVPPDPLHARAQRWGAAFHVATVGSATIEDHSKRFVACGDFCLGSSFENAVESGLAAAATVQRWNAM